MLRLFTYLYSFTYKKGTTVSLSYLLSFLRFVIRIISNTLLPLYFIITSSSKKYRIVNNGSLTEHRERILVSFTSFPKRINKVWLVVESLLRQSYKPDLVILWLSKEQFESLNVLPARLLNLQKRGLMLKIKEGDMRSHKKYYYAFREYPNDVIITVDDDIIYSPDLIKYLVETYRKNPNCVCANHVRRVEIENEYTSWSIVDKSGVDEKNMQIGVGGVLYPPYSKGFLDSNTINYSLAKNVAPLADDLWLYAMCRLKGTCICRTDFKGLFLPIMINGNETLTSQNVLQNQNEVQLAKINNCFKIFNVK